MQRGELICLKGLKLRLEVKAVPGRWELSQKLVELGHQLLLDLFAFACTNMVPAVLNRRHFAQIERVAVHLDESNPLLAVHCLGPNPLQRDAFKHFLSQVAHLLHELTAQLIDLDLLKHLQLVLIE